MWVLGSRVRGGRRGRVGRRQAGWHGEREARRTADLRQDVLDEPNAAGGVEDRGEERNNEHHESEPAAPH